MGHDPSSRPGSSIAWPTRPASTGLRSRCSQGARRPELLAALDALAGSDETFGDEAELLERRGIRVATVPGEAWNLKVTDPSDLRLVRALVADAAERVTARLRHGYGHDSHPFGAADGLRLGGVVFADAPRLHGHSDGDVALHAVCDALLGAAGLGDLGQLFPPGDPATRGVDSRDLVGAVVQRVRDQGWHPASVDLMIEGARPRLGRAGVDEIRAALAHLIGVDRASVSVKASTGNLSGDAGAGRVISASALVAVVEP
jgi:2-C-methyl-D-erythritol 4-phosphate cytidylyltransferase/2-C-methyl-D-erythritol 2,4-cyclodiphosphate synthase